MTCLNKVDVQWCHKPGVYWRTIVHFKKIDFSAYSRGIGLIPALKVYRDGLSKMFPTLPFDCPVLPNKYEGKLEFPLDE